MRSIRFLILSAAAVLAQACSHDASVETSEGDDGVAVDDITQVDHSKVKRQSIGNCWLYATVGWVEALNKAETGTELNLSETYLTYWHWFDQIANGSARAEINTGGSWTTAIELMNRYGLMTEKDFIATEEEAEMSARQSSALDKINASLKSGDLKDSAARRDRAKVRAALDAAFALTPEVKEKLDKTFKAAVSRTLDRSRVTAAEGILRTKEIPVRLKAGPAVDSVSATLADAIGTSRGWASRREGRLAWNEVDHPYRATDHRSFEKRLQAALHDQQPIIVSWKVDFNALTSSAVFSLEELQRKGPGRQGGHMTVLHDYEAEVPELGLLKAGETATPEQMTAALGDGTKVLFWRTKNSWGGIRPDRWASAAIPGYHDLTTAYMVGPIKSCEQVNGTSDPNDCYDEKPWWDAVLPPGY